MLNRKCPNCEKHFAIIELIRLGNGTTDDINNQYCKTCNKDVYSFIWDEFNSLNDDKKILALNTVLTSKDIILKIKLTKEQQDLLINNIKLKHLSTDDRDKEYEKYEKLKKDCIINNSLSQLKEFFLEYGLKDITITPTYKLQNYMGRKSKGEK